MSQLDPVEQQVLQFLRSYFEQNLMLPPDPMSCGLITIHETEGIPMHRVIAALESLHLKELIRGSIPEGWTAIGQIECRVNWKRKVELSELTKKVLETLRDEYEVSPTDPCLWSESIAAVLNIPDDSELMEALMELEKAGYIEGNDTKGWYALGANPIIEWREP